MRAIYAVAALALIAAPAFFEYQAVAGIGATPRLVFGASPENGAAPSRSPARANEPMLVALLRQDPAGADADSSSAPCPTLEEAYLAISQATEGADIATISGALGEVEADPEGAGSDEASPLAGRLREALALRPAAPICPNVLVAVREAVQLAQVASAAALDGPQTGAVGEPDATSPLYSAISSGTAGGARAHGYCPDLTTGCVG